MAKNTSPIFELEPRIASVTLSAANTARDGSGTITSLVAGAAEGTRIDRVTFMSAQATAAANSANVGRLWISTDTGSTWFLLDEVAITAVTASNTAVGAKNVLTYAQGILLKNATYILGCSMAVRAGAQDDHDVIAQGGDFAA